MYKKEVERKFLVNSDCPDLIQYESYKIQQGYLNQKYDSLEVRVRCEKDEYYLILKDKGTISRNELTYKISKHEYDISIQLCGGKVINKTRYLVPSTNEDGVVFEVDVYDDFDFITVEYESDNETKVQSIILEDWFGTEVTYDEKYKNMNLAFNILKK